MNSSSTPRVSVERFVALRGAPPLDLRLPPGLRSLVVPEGPLAELLLVCLAGVERPWRGRLRIAGRDPSASPLVRRRIGLTLPAEGLEGGERTLGQLLTRIRALRGGHVASRSAWLATEAFLARRAGDCPPEHRRRFALALALETPDPQLIALHEPWHELSADEQLTLWRTLRELAQQNVTVLLTTHEHNWAERFDDSPYVWDERASTRAGWCARVRVGRGDPFADWLEKSRLVLRPDPDHPSELEVELPDERRRDELTSALSLGEVELLWLRPHGAALKSHDHDTEPGP